MSPLVTDQVAIIPEESRRSAVSWGAIAAGGIAAAAFSLFLIQLGAGIGLSVISPWSNSAASGAAISITAGIGLCLVAIAASALGGLIAGRLRVRWVGLHTDEVYFRDTAHGFLAWAFATVISALLLASAATSMVGRATQGTASNPMVGSSTSYYTDMLFRSENSPVAPASPGAQISNDEIARVLARGLTSGAALPAADRTYVAQRVASRTGLTQQDAERRVDAIVAQAKNAADEARKAAAKLAFWMAAAMLCGAFAASFAAAIAGKERDD
jgi:hypothetical protein